MPLIQAHSLTKSYGSTRAVDGVSFAVNAGEIYGLVGSDGAGKTTTLRLLIGALRADAGTATVCGFDVAEKPEEVRSRVGYLSQRFSLYEDLSVLENIRFFAEVRGLSSTRVEAALPGIARIRGALWFSSPACRGAFRWHETKTGARFRPGHSSAGAASG